MDPERPSASADGGSANAVSTPYQRKLLAERAAILVVFSLALAGLAVLAALWVPSIEWKLPAVVLLALAGMVCALFARDRRFKAAQSSSVVPTAAFVLNLLILVLALLMQFVASVLRM